MAKDAGKKSFLEFFKVKNIDDEDEFEDDLFDEDEDEYDDYDDYDDDYVKPKKAKAKPQAKPVQQAAATQQTYRSYSDSSQPKAASPAGGKLVNFKDSARVESVRSEHRSSNNGNEVYVIKPHETDEAQYIIDLLIQKRTVVVNIEGLEINVAQRIIDYIGGACYAMGGSLSGVSMNIFIATPHEVEVSGDLREEIVNQDSLSPFTQY